MFPGKVILGRFVSICFDVFSQQVEQYSGQRDLDAFKSYLNKMVEQKDEKVESEEKEVSEKEPDDEVLVSFPCTFNTFLSC